MMNATYMSLNGEAISFDLDAAAGIARGFSTRRPSWSATLVYDLKNSAFIELRSSPQDIRGYSKGECEEVGALYIQTTRSEEHTSELQSLMRTSYAVFCWQQKTKNYPHIRE